MTNPAYKLDVNGNARVSGNNNQFGGGVVNNQPIGASFRQTSVGSWIGARFDSSGTSSGTSTDCVVIGSMGVGKATIGAHTYNLDNWAQLYIINPNNSTISDERLKENIITANNDICYSNIKNIHLVRYNYRADSIAKYLGKDDTNRLGVIAQEFREIFPRSVMEQEDPISHNSYLSINTDQMYYTLIGCVQKQQEKIEDQQNQINELKSTQVLQAQMIAQLMQRLYAADIA